MACEHFWETADKRRKPRLIKDLLWPFFTGKEDYEYEYVLKCIKCNGIKRI